MIQELLDEYGSLTGISNTLLEDTDLNKSVRREYSKIRSIVRKRIERLNAKYKMHYKIPKSLTKIPFENTTQLLRELKKVEDQYKNPTPENSITARKVESKRLEKSINKSLEELTEEVSDRRIGQKLNLNSETIENDWAYFMKAFKFVMGDDVFSYLESNRVVAWFESTKDMKKGDRLRELTGILNNYKSSKGMATFRRKGYNVHNKLKEFSKYMNKTKLNPKRISKDYEIRRKEKLKK